MTTADLKPLDMDPALDPWERQPSETPRRYGQFATYRELGRARTLAKVAENLTLNAAYLRSVAAAMQWADRVAAWDVHRDQLHQAAWLDARREAAVRDGELLDAAIGKIAERLDALDPAELTPAELVRLLDVALRHRRALFGDPAVVALTGPGGDPLAVQLAEFTAMPVDQRRTAIIALAHDVRRRLEAPESTDSDPLPAASGGV